MIETDFKDRVPQYPGRVVLTPVQGEANTFDMTRADEPLVEGTPINKVTLDSISHSRLTGRFYVPEVSSKVQQSSDITYDGATYAKSYVVLEGVPALFSIGQRIMLNIPDDTQEIAVIANTFNDITVNTIMQPNKRYELVYNGEEFDATEV